MSGMDAILKQRLDYEVLTLEHMRHEYAARLDHLGDYKGAYLRWSVSGNHRYYYIKSNGSKSYRYVDSTKLQDVQRVREARFLEEVIGRIDHNVSLLKECAEGFLPFDPSSVNDSLPKVYRCNVAPASELYETESRKWLKERMEYQKKFPENYPENKRHKTSDGVMVKTVSELALYEMIKAAGLALIYELPLPLQDYGPVIYPDITVLSPIDMKTEIIVEFVGRLDQPQYRTDFAKRVGRYISSGYIPGVNLFFVFNDAKGNIDSLQIAKLIADITGARSRVLS